MDFLACKESSSNPIVVVEENKSRFEVHNKSRKSISKVRVDGCLINDHRERCDWIIEVEKPGSNPTALEVAMFVELKGCDLDKAVSQLRSTLAHTERHYRQTLRQCYAVTTRIPRHGVAVSKRCLDFYRETSATLYVKNIKSVVSV